VQVAQKHGIELSEADIASLRQKTLPGGQDVILYVPAVKELSLKIMPSAVDDTVSQKAAGRFEWQFGSQSRNASQNNQVLQRLKNLTQGSRAKDTYSTLSKHSLKSLSFVGGAGPHGLGKTLDGHIDDDVISHKPGSTRISASLTRT
jgi:hypothetical protein